MKRIISIVMCALICFTVLSGCDPSEYLRNRDGSVIGVGDLETFEYKVGNYSEVRVELQCDINYYSARSDTIKLEIQPNLHEFIVVEKNNGTLIIRANVSILFTGKSPILTISMPGLLSLSHAGAGVITTHDVIRSDSFNLSLEGAGSGKINLATSNLTANMTGAGNYELIGSADSAVYSMSGAGKLDAMALQTRTAKVNFNGSGIFKVNCTDNLTITASGVGTVEYKGSPTLTLVKNGLVIVKKVD